MSHQVFLSYKREDEAPAARLAQALEHHGLRVWWDRGLPGGESWHAHIDSALDAAGCVVVLWSVGSTGPDGQYVRDEARRGQARGLLVPALIDKVAPPLGFGELQAVDLTRWRKNPNDPFLLDLVAAVRAKLAGQPVPKAKGPTRLWARRFTVGGGASAMAALLWVLGLNMFDVRDKGCSLPLAQPNLSDLCGSLGIGNRPSREERMAWQTREPSSCAALREHVNRFPAGAYRSVAADLLAAARHERALEHAPTTRTTRGYVRQSEQGWATEAQARADALARAELDARDLGCAPREAHERLDGLTVEPAAYDCRSRPGSGTVCALDYHATCQLAVQALVERCG